MTPVSVLDLFSGAGGLTAGFHEASPRFRTLRAVEMDVAAAASYEATFGRNVVYNGDIAAWLREEDVPEVDVIVGGPPCQGFSTLGKQDVEDERNALWKQYLQTIVRAKPKYFVVENVAAFGKSAQFEEFLAETGRDGQISDYAFKFEVLNAADYGAPQARKRAVLIGHHRDLPFPGFPVATHRGTPVTVRQAFSLIPATPTGRSLPERSFAFANRELPGAYKASELHLDRSYSDLSLKRFAAIPEGGNRFSLPDSLKARCWIDHTSGSADVMGRMHWDEPSVTVRTEFFKPEKGRYLHPSEMRAITHYEAAVLQGFPEAHRFVGSKTAIAKQIGNAVPIPLGKAIGGVIAAQFSETEAQTRPALSPA